MPDDMVTTDEVEPTNPVDPGYALTDEERMNLAQEQKNQEEGNPEGRIPGPFDGDDSEDDEDEPDDD